MPCSAQLICIMYYNEVAHSQSSWTICQQKLRIIGPKIEIAILFASLYIFRQIIHVRFRFMWPFIHSTLIAFRPFREPVSKPKKKDRIKLV